MSGNGGFPSAADLAVDVSDDEVVVRATIARPEKRNALNEEVLLTLQDVIEAADTGETRVLVISGEGGLFSAGGDFTEMPIGGAVEEYRESFSALTRLMLALQDCSAVTVAAVQGDCLAGGLGLAASCEFVLATESATFGTPEVQVGLFPVQAMVPLMRTVPEKQGLELLFTGRRIGAERAHDMGLVTAVHPDESFDDELDAFVETLAASSPTMLSMGKEAYYAQRDREFASALQYCKEVVALLAMSDDTEEGIEAFMMDRSPEWEGR